MDWKVSDFLNTELVAYAAYDNIRKIPSYIDGLKMSQRKVIYTLMKKYPKEFVKTETLANITAAFTNYLHGANNIATTVCTTMTQNFVGANNYALTTGNSGGWGCRINPSAAAPRYTRICLSNVTKAIMHEDDEEIIGRQFFEGDYIEPKFFVPVFPVLLLNGSKGLSTGFSCTIYPRNPGEVITYIKKKISGINPKTPLLPWFKGFTGEVRVNDDTGDAESVGVIKRINTTNYEITELPIGMEYQTYIGVLDKLYEDKVIADYDDCCEPKTDTILFKIKTTRQFTNTYSDPEKLNKIFKLVKSLSENLNCIDENNQVREFKSVKEIIDAYIDIRMQYYVKRKKYLIDKINGKISLLASKYAFCAGVIDGSIKITKVAKDKIIAQLEKVKEIIKVDDSYDYLLRMPIYSITKEKMAEMAEQLKNLKAELKETKVMKPEDFWIIDLNSVKKSL